MADTASDLIWIQCKSCTECYGTGPIFNLWKSSTYQPISCSAPQCSKSSNGYNPSCVSNKCQYKVIYGEASSSTGTIVTDIVTLGSAQFPETTFGCGFTNVGINSSGYGIIGLGNGPNSLISQLDKSIGGKFSYCLVPLATSKTVSNTFHFGENAVVSGNGTVSTPLITSSTFYYINLKAITVGEKRIPLTSSSGSKEGNMMIDSGSLLSNFPTEVLNAVTTEIKNQITVKPVDDPSSQLSLCYIHNGFTLPKLVMNFEGADVVLNDSNMWLTVLDDYICFAANPSNTGILGNLAQMNFLIGFDKKRKTVSFKPADCTKQN